MNSEGLSGLGVMVTRPSGQCESLCQLIRDSGGTAVAWPALDILPHDPHKSAAAELLSARPDDIAVFVSRNAVRRGSTLLPPGRPVVTAVGPSTFRALKDIGIEPGIVPTGFDSESLLRVPALADMDGRTVFIIRGVGGRELLANELRRRGARVVYVEVYLRRPRQPDATERERLLHLWREGAIGIYTATSVEILTAIGDGLGEDFADLLAGTPLVTASRRVVQRSEESGHRADRVLAPAPDDASLVEAIVDWWRRTGSTIPSRRKNERVDPTGR
jgi:uroporphyrinogen-III synthase